MIFASSVGAIGAAAVLGAGWLCGCFKSRNGSNGGANNSGYQPVPFGESDVEAGGSHQQVYPADAPPAYSVVIDHEASVAIESKDVEK
ncbi:hypothetical protein HK100_010607 [Physocladia obscura]|uniref:Secreted protein n=1 Tax=Physocladia obscura TaxID=109957 RepID=A0AAD5SMS3_9FUNG|nr:hypothetical protein HK100_010607 [Physocladia obscura]